MRHELKIPELGESIREVQLGKWLKPEGQWADKDESLVEIESEKATVDLPAPVAGVLTEILKQSGQTAAVGEVVAYFEESAAAPAKESIPDRKEQRPSPPPAQPMEKEKVPPSPDESANGGGQTPFVMPAAARILATQAVRPEAVEATGPGGRLLKEDALRAVEPRPIQPAAPPPAHDDHPKERAAPASSADRQEETVPMSLIRRRIAQRLVEAQQQAALLTTFNEIDMSAVIALRQKYREPFEKKYKVRLGFMSFFVKAVVESLKQAPALNAEVRGDDIVYHNFYDIGIAVGGGKGLVVPILRNAERMSFAEIETAIGDFANRAQAGKLKPEELLGGTFTISNGGVYGSLLSTPIVNPPQSGILGLHAIEDRVVARDKQAVILPMMYVALTYDHRLVDGREAVTFLRQVKAIVEDPSRILLEI